MHGAKLISSSLLCLAAMSASGQTTLNDWSWSEQEPGLGSSTPWGIRLPQALALAPTNRFGTSVAVLHRNAFGTSWDWGAPWYGTAHQFSEITGSIEIGWTYPDALPWNTHFDLLATIPNNGDGQSGILGQMARNGSPVYTLFSIRYPTRADDPIDKQTPTVDAIAATLAWAADNKIPILLVDSPAAISAANEPVNSDNCSKHLQDAIKSARARGTTMFVDSRNKATAKCDNVMHIAPSGNVAFSRPNSRSVLAAPERLDSKTFADPIVDERWGSGYAAVIAAGVAGLVNETLSTTTTHPLPPEVLRGFLRAGAQRCSTAQPCESGRTLNAENSVRLAADTASRERWVVAPSATSDQAVEMLARGEAVYSTGRNKEDWFFVQVHGGRELSVGATGITGYGYEFSALEAFRYVMQASGNMLWTRVAKATSTSSSMAQMSVPSSAEAAGGVWIRVAHKPAAGNYKLYTIEH